MKISRIPENTDQQTSGRRGWREETFEVHLRSRKKQSRVCKTVEAHEVGGDGGQEAEGLF